MKKLILLITMLTITESIHAMNLGERLKSLADQLTNFPSKKQDLSTAIINLKTDLENKEKATEKTIKTLEDQTQKLTSELAAAKAGHTEALDKLNTELITAQTNVKKTQDQLTTETTKATDLQTKLGKAQKDIAEATDSLRGELKVAANKVKNLEAKLKQAAIDSAEAQQDILKRLNPKIDTLQKENAELTTKNKALMDSIAMLPTNTKDILSIDKALAAIKALSAA
ncbi:hypothetical protein A3F06_00200 [candidate division TM6 bacterium RIFCSPHIGHO2_12_FULL_36_22]|nr:MAG: hypothetical protein A3F06_00200 [candidate division TM6 bacterium RIFCSPHIGHO2_12_FULL_36_22]